MVQRTVFIFKICIMDFSQTPITFILIALNVLVSVIGFSNHDFMNKGIGWPYRTRRENQYYRFISSGFLHGDWMHLIFNMFTFFFFGQNVEIIFKLAGLGGSIAFISLYFLALIISDLPSYFKHLNDPRYRSLGASGAVSAIVFASIIFNPWQSIYVYGAIKISALIFALLYIVYCVYMGKREADNVNHDAHLWGSLFGLAYTLALVGALRPDLFERIWQLLRHPSLFGNG